MVPCPSQPDGWRAQEQARYRRLLADCDSVEVLEPVYSAGCMLRRNREMILRAQLVMSSYDGSAGGPAATVRLAQQQGVEILPLWL